MKLGSHSDGLRGFALVVAGIAALTAALIPFRSELGILNEGSFYLFLTLLASAKWGRWTGMFAAVLSNVALNFFFVEPLHQFQVAEPGNILGLAVFLGVSVVASSLLSSAQEAANEARTRQVQTDVLLRLSRSMIGQTDPQAALDALVNQVVDAFRAAGAAVLSRSPSGWQVASASGPGAAREPAPEDRNTADRALQERAIQGVGETGLRTSRLARVVGRARPRREGAVIVAPLVVGDLALGVLRLDGPIQTPAFRERPEELLQAFAGEAALALQRAELARAAARTRVLEEVSEAKTNLMMSVSHDLKTPLATIKTSVSSLLDRSVDWTDADVRAFLETIDSQVDQLNRVISDILDLNRVESGAVHPLLRDAEALDLLEDARERTAGVTEGRKVEVEAPDGLSLNVDPSLAVQALVNLIENAAKYSRPAGDIRLAAGRSDGAVELWVEDTGPGIPAAELQRVFEPFYRLPQAGRDTRGSGLGLALVKALANLSGGSVDVASGPSGSRFSLRFPAAESKGRET